MKCHNFLYRWVDKRGRIPWFVRKLWPKAHWCPEMDYLLIVDNIQDCFCGLCGQNTEDKLLFFESLIEDKKL